MIIIICNIHIIQIWRVGSGHLMQILQISWFFLTPLKIWKGCWENSILESSVLANEWHTRAIMREMHVLTFVFNNI